MKRHKTLKFLHQNKPSRKFLIQSEIDSKKKKNNKLYDTSESTESTVQVRVETNVSHICFIIIYLKIVTNLTINLNFQNSNYNFLSPPEVASEF